MTAETTASAAVAQAATRPRRRRDPAKWISATLLAALFSWSALSLDIKWTRLIDAPERLYTIFRLMFTRMSWSDVERSVEAMWESIAMAWLGTLLAAVFAVPLAFLAAENLVPRWFSFLTRQVFNVLRAIPELIIVVTLIPMLGLTTNAGILALGIGSIGTLSKLCSEVVEGIDPGPIEAADAVGASQIQRLRWAVIPQAIPEITSFVLYRFEINIRVSAILGVLGVGGIGRILRDNITFKNWGVAGVALIVVVLATIAVDIFSGAIRRRIISGPRASTAMSSPTPVADVMM